MSYEIIKAKPTFEMFSVLILHILQADQFSDFHIRSVLCVPIWNSNHQIIGK